MTPRRKNSRPGSGRSGTAGSVASANPPVGRLLLLSWVQIALLSLLVIVEIFNGVTARKANDAVTKELEATAQRLAHQAVRELIGSSGAPLRIRLPQDRDNCIEALQIAREALIYDPGNATAKRVRLIAYASLGEVEAAKALALEAVRTRPNCFKEFCNLGTVYYAIGEFQDAKKAFERALKLNSRCANCMGGLAETQFQLGDRDNSEANFRAALKAVPDSAEFHLGLGRVLREQGTIDEAEIHYRQAVALSPTFGEAHEVLGLFLYSLNRHHDAALSLCRAQGRRGGDFRSVVELQALLQHLNLKTCDTLTG